MDNPGYERRRRADRRANTRSGKFERRKNTCGDCLFYKSTSAIAGLCQKHQVLLKAADFACVYFQAVETAPSED